MSALQIEDYAEEVGELARPLEGSADLDPLMDRIGDARFVLLGEASHGTHDYYTWRTEITKRLVTEKGFSFVAVEGDWPDCHRINRWVKDAGDGSARDVLRGFERWPTWMWANAEIESLISWLREHNNAADDLAERVGFYGLDVYSLWDSMRALIGYLEEYEPDAVDLARQAWRCFEPYAEDPQEYAWATRLAPTSCEDEVVALLARLQRDGAVVGDGDEARFDAEQNAAAAAGAERYYRTMVRGGAASWNIRDTHMVDTLDRLLARSGPRAKAVVWEHNTHIGDARATDMAAAGMVNVGQLVRERHASEGVVLVGFGSYEGEVVAARTWGAPMERMLVPPARHDSQEALLHEARIGDSLFIFPHRSSGWLEARIGHRAIGVVYHPEVESAGNYVPTVFGRRYDAFCYLERTSALQPLHRELPQPTAELETYPHGR